MKRLTWSALAAAVMALIAVPLFAQGRSVMSAPSEKALRGVSAAEHAAKQSALFAALRAETPIAIGVNPVIVALDPSEKAELSKPQPRTAAPLRIGVVKSISRLVSIEGLSGTGPSEGVMQKSAGGGLVWALVISSPEAQGIRLHFGNFALPKGAELYLYNDSAEVRGPYQDQGPNGNGEFWSNTLFSDNVTVVLRFAKAPSAEALAKVSFFISDVAHIGAGFPKPTVQENWSTAQCGNAACVVDASCGNLGPATAAASAVAKMEWIKMPYIYTCTGGLIADTDTKTQRRLFLTANHCLNKTTKNLETFFNFRTDACEGTCPVNPAPATTGATVVKTGKTADFTLLELGSGSLPAGAVFLGWDANPVAFTDGADLYRISNPNFGPQVFSHHQVDATAVTCTLWTRGPRIYSRDILGATDGGSSGSPVVNSNGQIVGQLSGCCGYNCGDVCDAASNSTVDGAFAYYYGDVASVLNPGGPGQCKQPGESCSSGSECCSNSCRRGACR
jgi:lysyl endopeptidase